MGSSLIAFDTDHIKRYVFGTNKLKEIRGASSLLDYLNRDVMKDFAGRYHAKEVFANGGSGLFYAPTENAELFGQDVQRAYQEVTGGGSSITYIILEIPAEIANGNVDIEQVDMRELFELLQWRLQEQKLHSLPILSLQSHPFLRPCDACGIEYTDASEKVQDDDDERDRSEDDNLYCVSCQRKRSRDIQVKKFITRFIKEVATKRDVDLNDYLWKKVIKRLFEMGYHLPDETRRPKDFNIFSNFKGSKDYFALVYADANNMGSSIEDYQTLNSRRTIAHTIDDAVYEAVCTAITRHLKIDDHLKPQSERSDDLQYPIFPFDILLMGGDDICMVVPASAALDVAITLAETFHGETANAHKRGETQKASTLSVGVVLAPIKYPFGLLQEMADTTLKFAKKAGADARAKQEDDTRINFMVVTGSSSADFKTVHNAVYHRRDKEKQQEFYATLRPYAPKDLQHLLQAIREPDGANLGRTKLHQIREAVLKMNLTTSVSDGLSVLHNWREKQRNHVVRSVYEFAASFQMPRSNPDDPVSGFPRVIFPWFKDGTKMYQDVSYEVYRSSLLDFIELYDFISREGGENNA